MIGIRHYLAGICLVAACSAPIGAIADTCASTHPGRAVVDSILNLDLQRAEQQISGWSASESDQPMLEVFRALIEMAKPYVNDKLSREPYWDRALAQFDHAIATLEPRLGKGEMREADGQLALGLAQAYKSLIHAGRDQSIRAYRAASAGRTTLENLVSSTPDSGDAYVLLGMFEVLVDSVPEANKTALKLVNFTGDRMLGISYLEQAVERATVFAPEAARLLLMDVEHAETDLCRYRTLASDMNRLYPGNRPIALLNKIIPLQCRLAEQEGQSVQPAINLRINTGCGHGPRSLQAEIPAPDAETPLRVPAGFGAGRR